MIHHHKYLFTYKKTTYKKLFFIGAAFFCLSGSYFFTHTYLKYKINQLLIHQQTFFREQNLTLKFRAVSNSSWEIWPQATITDLILQKNIPPPSLPRTLWKAKQANISYSLWHPFSISIALDGEQFFCLKENTETCFQIHGSLWNIRIPLFNDYQKNSIYLQCDETFYTNVTQSTWNIKTLQLKHIKANLHWNRLAGQNDSLAFSDLSIQQLLVNFATLPPQKLENIQLQAALVKEKDTHDLYKLLIQKIDFSWNALSVNATGKLYISFPQIIPTGEISFHLNDVNQTIHQQIESLNCCNKLKEKLSQTSLPSQINFTLLIREGVFYLGAIPLQPSWYSSFQTLIKLYTK